MARRKGDPVNGWLNIDKPLGMTSTQVVGAVRRITNAAKIGHGGTLDPLASGVLPIALGEATKTVAWAMDGHKTYRFAIRFGVATATDDAEGETVATSTVRPTDEQIRAVLPSFTGSIIQKPPAFSALKVAGQRAYDLARAGEEVDLAPRTIVIDRLDLVARPDADTAELEVDCGKGTYVRALARDLAVALGSVGHVAMLRRTRVGPFTAADAILLDKLAVVGHSAHGFVGLLPVVTVLDDIPALALTEAEACQLRKGQKVAFLPVAERSPDLGNAANAGHFRAMVGDRLVAVVRIEGVYIRSLRVFND